MNQQNKTERWEEELTTELKVLLEEYQTTGSDERIVNVLELVDQLLSDARKEERERCLEELPKKKEHKTQCVNPYGFCNICLFNEAIDQAISAINNKK